MSAGREEIRFPSGEGECAGWWYPAAGSSPSPCVVLGHGFTATRHEGLDLYAREFAAAGLAALAFDYRHFGDSPGEPRAHFRLGRELEDWRSALALARGLGEIDSERVVAWGYSLGGGLVAATAARGEPLAAVVLSFPFLHGGQRSRGLPLRERLWTLPASLLDLCGRHTTVAVTGPPGSRSIFNRPGEQEGFERVVSEDSPAGDRVSAGGFVALASFKPVEDAAKVPVPAWVALGERDVSVEPGDIEGFVAAAPRAELHRYPYDHFDPLLPAAARTLARDQIEFLRRIGVLGDQRP